MISKKKNLSAVHSSERFPVRNKRFGIVVSEWNEEVTSRLLDAAVDTLLKNGVKASFIDTIRVPGSFELPYGASLLARRKNIHAVICIGCVIQGETRHFDFICQACANGITEVSLKYQKPVVFGVLTTNNMEQALERAGGRHGNKGVEAAYTALKLLRLEK